MGAIPARAEQVAPNDRRYLEGVRLLAAYLRAQGMPTNVAHLRREHVDALVTDQLERWRPSTACSRYRDVQQFFKWCVAEGEIRTSRW